MDIRETNKEAIGLRAQLSMGRVIFHRNSLVSECISFWPCRIGHSEPLQWEKIGKVANQTKLDVLSHSEPLWWEKIGKVVNWAKLAVPSHSEPLWWEMIGKVMNQVKLAVLSHSEPLWWE